MKKLILAVMVAVSFSTSATGTGDINAMSVDQKAGAIQAVRDSANQAMATNTAMLNKFNNDRANFTQADSDAMTAANATINSAQAKISAIQGAATLSAPTATYSVSGTPVYSGVSHRPGYGSINVAASSLPSNTPVNTPQGVKTAGSLPPQTQVSVPHVDAIIASLNVKGGQQDRSGYGSREHGTGNGSNNAANTASAHGLGGGAHIGGGSSMNGGFHGQW